MKGKNLKKLAPLMALACVLTTSTMVLSAAGITTAVPVGPIESGGQSMDYILANSSVSYLTWEEIGELDTWHLTLAQDEIYARHGRKFNTPEIRDYFNNCAWYSGTIEADVFDADPYAYLTDIELLNLQFLRTYQLNPSCKGQQLTFSVERTNPETVVTTTTTVTESFSFAFAEAYSGCFNMNRWMEYYLR